MLPCVGMSFRPRARPLLLLFSFAVCLLVATRCSETPAPDPIVSGIYMSQVPPAHFDFLKLQLENHGGEITGTACFESSGHLIMTGVPVHGSGSSISFTADSSNAAECAFNPTGTTIVARRGSDGMFKGT